MDGEYEMNELYARMFLAVFPPPGRHLNEGITR